MSEPYLSSRLCEHPNEVPHFCPCAHNCFCRSTTCPLTPKEPTAESLLGSLEQALTEQEPELFIVRLFDMFDGWMDVSGPLPKVVADAIWNEKTADGTKSTKFADGDYYRVFPANTRMLMTPEFLGR